MYKYFDVLEKYFGDLDLKKKEKLRSLYNEYYTHNQKINLVSRKDFDNFYLHHVIHSLTLSKYIKNNNSKIIDLGSGGGLPGIPLSIIFEKNNFLLVDSIKKKINTLDKIINNLKLKNVETLNARVESINNNMNFPRNIDISLNNDINQKVYKIKFLDKHEYCKFHFGKLFYNNSKTYWLHKNEPKTKMKNQF